MNLSKAHRIFGELYFVGTARNVVLSFYNRMYRVSTYDVLVYIMTYSYFLDRKLRRCYIKVKE